MSNKKRAAGTLSDAEVSAFCRDASMFVKAGIPLHEGVKSMYTDAGTGVLSGAVEAIDRALSQNKRLWEALEECSCFPRYMQSMVKIGETAGRLDDTLSSLADYYGETAAFKKRLRDALVYPVILICMMATVIAVLIWAVLPVFSEVLSQFDASAAATTDLIMNISFGVCIGLLVLLGVFLIAVAVIAILSRSEKGRERLSRTFSTSPLTKSMADKMTAGNFVLALSTTLKSGMTVSDAVELFLPSVKSPSLAKQISKIRDDINGGMTQDAAFAASGFFSQTDCRFIRVAAKSGSLDAAMEQLAHQFRERSSEQLERTISAVEPALVASLAVIIGAIMLSAMLPLIQIMSSIG